MTSRLSSVACQKQSIPEQEKCKSGQHAGWVAHIAKSERSVAVVVLNSNHSNSSFRIHSRPAQQLFSSLPVSRIPATLDMRHHSKSGLAETAGEATPMKLKHVLIT